MKRCTEIATEVHFRASRQRRSSERESVTLILEVPSFLFSYRAVRGVFPHSATIVTKRGVSLSFGNLEIRYRVFALVRINIRGENFERHRDQATTKLSLRFTHELGTFRIEGDRFTGDRSQLG